MIVYIEQVILDNIVVNFLLLYLTNKIFNKKVKLYKILLADFLGTICALLFPLISVSGVLLILLKILLGISMVLIGCYVKNFRQFISNFFCFLFLTAITGGLAFAIIFALYPQTNIIEGAIIYNGLPIGIILLCIFVLLKLFYNLVIVVRKNAFTGQNMCKLQLLNNNQKINITAYIDTGNLLVHNNKPVILISYPTFKKLYKISNEDFLKSNYKIENSCYIDTQTPNGNNKILIFNIDEIVLINDKKNKKLDCNLGLTLSNIENKFGCNALIGSIAFNQGGNNV